MSSRATVIAVTSLSLEARIASGSGVSVICSQAAQLVACLEAAIERGALGIISFGVAGGLAPDLVAGDWVIGTGVRTEQGYYPADQRWARRLLDALPGAVHAEIVGADAPVAQSSDKRRLHAQTGAMAVDMESMSPPGSPPRTTFHLPSAARSSTLHTGICHRLRWSDCNTMAHPICWPSPGRWYAGPVRFRHSCASQSMRGPLGGPCFEAEGCWVQRSAAPITVSPPPSMLERKWRLSARAPCAPPARDSRHPAFERED